MWTLKIFVYVALALESRCEATTDHVDIYLCNHYEDMNFVGDLAISLYFGFLPTKYIGKPLTCTVNFINRDSYWRGFSLNIQTMEIGSGNADTCDETLQIGRNLFCESLVDCYVEKNGRLNECDTWVASNENFTIRYHTENYQAPPKLKAEIESVNVLPTTK
ncbi:uncharacterized protein LOC131950202 [Physella acuta]|uniref:uncharacterized protein LOC131950202 n=1 Tax=Physella acuta TaxID=109671 RepID=UPI0027DC8198|nr:uncharacterized protein LOC131950202 [Physella acuta]